MMEKLHGLLELSDGGREGKKVHTKGGHKKITSAIYSRH